VSTHKLTRKELKHDAFTEWTGNATEFLQEHYLRVGVGLLVVIAAIVGVNLYQRGQDRAAKQAAYLLFQGESLIGRGEFAAAVQPLKEVGDRFGGSRFAGQARFDLAQAQAGLGDNQAALATLEQAAAGARGDAALQRAVLQSKAAVLIALQRPQDAEAACRALLARQDVTPRERYDATLLFADVLRASGRLGDAVQTLTALQQEINSGKLAVPPRDLETRIQLLKALAG